MRFVALSDFKSLKWDWFQNKPTIKAKPVEVQKPVNIKESPKPLRTPGSIKDPLLMA